MRNEQLPAQVVDETLSTYKVVRCFPFNHELLESVQEYQQRLSYFKNLFLTWCGQHSFKSALKYDPEFRSKKISKLHSWGLYMNAAQAQKALDQRALRLKPAYN